MVNSSMSCSEIRKLYMEQYNAHKTEIDKITSDGIELNRKGDCTLRLVDKEGNFTKNAKIKITQKSHDFKIGANIFMLDEFQDEKNNKEYRRFFKEYFNLATVPFYWDTLEPEENKPRFFKDSKKIYRRPAPDLCVEYCEQNGIIPKLHCLFYDKFTPDWMHNLSLTEAEAKFEKRVKEISERYSGKMYEFEVVNELLCVWDQKTSMFFKDDIVEWAFDISRKYLPNETLVINETFPLATMVESKNRSPYYMMLKYALANGTTIDKIGIQNHAFTGTTSHTTEEYDAEIKNDVKMNNPFYYLEGLELLSRFNLPIEITEITVPTFGDTEEHEELQADMLELWLTLFFSHRAVDAAVYWNTVDGYAYTGNSNWIENHARGGLWHHDLTPKKSAERLHYLFHEKWHTDLEAETDLNGEISFRGFYGEYEAEVDGKAYRFTIHKGEENKIILKLN